MLNVQKRLDPHQLAHHGSLPSPPSPVMTTSPSQEEENNETTNIRQAGKVASSLAAGALAGATAKSVIAPLDRSKIFFQTNETKGYRFRYALRWLRHGYQTDGFLSLWRGNSATMARIVPYAAVQFMTHEQYKRLLSVEDPASPSYLRFLAGSLAGVTGQALVYPLDRARAVMAVTSKSQNAAQYKSLRTVFVSIVQSEGVLALYRGFTPAMLGVIPYAGTSFFTYGSLKKLWSRDGAGEPSPGKRLVFGATAGLLGQTASYPLDIVRRRMQTAYQLGRRDRYTTVVGTLKHVYRNEGLKRGLYKGLSMNFIKGPIATGISFTVFDYANSSFSKFVISVT